MGNQAQYSFTQATGWGRKRKINHLSKVFNHLLPAKDSSMTLLEIGSGRGEFAEIVRDSGMKYIGVEPSDSLRASLVKNGFEILPDPIPKLSVADSSIDMIYSYDVLEHLENYSTILSFFNEAKRVLKPGGHIIVIAPNAETIGNLFYLHEYQHNYFTNVDRIVSLLADADYTIVKAKPFLTSLGTFDSKLINAVDRIFANLVLVLARNVLFTAIIRGILGRGLLFKIHKNIYDHVCVVGKK